MLLCATAYGAISKARTFSLLLHEIAISLTPRLARDAMLCTDAAGVYRTYANRTGRAIERVTSSSNQRMRANGVYHIQNVKAFHARFREFVQPFRVDRRRSTSTATSPGC